MDYLYDFRDVVVCVQTDICRGIRDAVVEGRGIASLSLQHKTHLLCVSYQLRHLGAAADSLVIALALYIVNHSL